MQALLLKPSERCKQKTNLVSPALIQQHFEELRLVQTVLSTRPWALDQSHGYPDLLSPCSGPLSFCARGILMQEARGTEGMGLSTEAVPRCPHQPWGRRRACLLGESCRLHQLVIPLPPERGGLVSETNTPPSRNNNMGNWLGFVPFLKGQGGRIIHSHQNVTEWVFLRGKDPASGTQRAGTSARPHPWALQKPRQMTAEEAHGADAPFQTTPAQADFGDPGRFLAPSPGCAHFTDGQLRPLVPSPASLEHWEMRVASTPNPLPFRRAASGAVLPAGCPSSPPSSWRARRLRCPPRPKPAPFSPSLQVGGCFIYEVLGGGLLGISVSPAVEFIGLCCLFMKLHLSRASEAS